MAGGNFTNTIAIDENGQIIPSGPLTTARGETMSTVYVWVFQLNDDGTGAFAAGSQDEFSAGQKEWRAPAPLHEGRFRPGPAVGMAVATSTGADGKVIVYWWSETIVLHEESTAASLSS